MYAEDQLARFRAHEMEEKRIAWAYLHEGWRVLDGIVDAQRQVERRQVACQD